MAVTLTSRLGIHQWSSDTDPWAREDFDADNAKLEALAVIGTQGTAANRPTAGVQRRLYLATDAHRAYIDEGGAWQELLLAGIATASQVVNVPAGTIAATTVQAAIAELDAEKHPKMATQGTYTLTGTSDRTLAGYTANAQTAAYTATPAALTTAATLADLNTLRTAVENLRTDHEDIRALVVAAVGDLRTLGLLG